MIIGYRIANCKYIDDLTGTGARLYGGRWNSVGRSMVYLASSRSLAVLEVLVHLAPTIVPDNFCIAEISVPDNSILEVNPDELPYDWQDIGGPTALKKLGDEFLRKQEYLLMKVPSAIVKEESNYLLNPLHKLASKVIIRSTDHFDFDQRLV